MKKIWLVALFSLFSFLTSAQENRNATLYKTIMSVDSLLFEVGFNTCDIGKFELLLSPRLRFYHDKAGVSDKKKFMTDLRSGLCRNQSAFSVKRLLVRESVQVFPLYKDGKLYGAVQNGSHLFAENGGAPGGIAKFSNVWEMENGEWKLVTSISYDHRPYVARKEQ